MFVFSGSISEAFWAPQTKRKFWSNLIPDHFLYSFKAKSNINQIAPQTIVFVENVLQDEFSQKSVCYRFRDRMLMFFGSRRTNFSGFCCSEEKMAN